MTGEVRGMETVNNFEVILKDIMANVKTKNNTSYEELEHKQKLEEWQSRNGLDSEYKNARLSNASSENKKQIIQEFITQVDKGNAPFLIAIGSTGTGKTYTAAAIMNELEYGTYIDMPELSLKLSSADRYGSEKTREQVMHELAKCKLLVLDEIGRFTNRKAEEQEILFYLINKRYQNKRPMILCSNLNGAEFAKHIGEALIDRIKSRRLRLDLTGESLRHEEVKKWT